MKILFPLWMMTLLLILISAAKNPIWGDSLSACGVAQRILREGHPVEETMRSLESRRQMTIENREPLKYPALYVLACIPSRIVTELFEKPDGNFSNIETLLVQLFPAMISATLTVVTAFFYQQLGATQGWSIILSCLILFTTPLWHYSRSLYSENLQALLFTSLIFLWVVNLKSPSKRGMVGMGTLFGMLINCKALYGLLLPLAIAYVLFRNDRGEYIKKKLLICGISILPWVFLMLGFNYLRFGNLFISGYGNGRDGALGFNNPLLDGTYDLLMSPGKSLFLYAPLLIFSLFKWAHLWKLNKSSTASIAISCLVFLILYAKWHGWHGGWCWGPRYLVPLIPVLASPLIFVSREKTAAKFFVATLALFGFIVNLLGILFHPTTFMIMIYSKLAPLFQGTSPLAVRDDTFAMHYIPDLSPIYGHWWYFKAFVFGASTQIEHYPWRGMGISGWRPEISDIPQNLDLWFTPEFSTWGIFFLLLIGILFYANKVKYLCR